MKHLLLAAAIFYTATAHPVKSLSVSAMPADPAVSAGHLSLIPLPWLNIKVGLENEVAHISWSAKEGNEILRFEIEHSIDDKTFSPVGVVPAAGSNSETNSYNWLHSPAPGLNYYKIKEVNKDGTFTYSEDVCLPYTKGLTRTLAVPNKLTRELTLFFPEPAHKLTLTVYNAEGSSLMNKAILEGSTSEVLDLSAYTKGVYFIHVLSSNKTEIVRVVKNNINLSAMSRRSFNRD